MTPADVFSEVLRFGAGSPLDILDEVFAANRRIIRDGDRAAQVSVEAMTKVILIFFLLHDNGWRRFIGGYAPGGFREREPMR